MKVARHPSAGNQILGQRCSYLLALALSTLLIYGCSVDSTKPQYSTKMPRITRGYHIVKEGETIYQIAWRYGWDYQELARANSLKRPYIIFPGQRIRLYLPMQGVRKPPVAKRSIKGKPRTPSKNVSNASPGKTSYDSSSINWGWPVKGSVLSDFKSGSPLHQGLKISVPKGSKVRAAAPGTVVYVGAGIRGLEELIIVEHSGGFLSAYAHNQKILKKETEKVKAGEIIAETGSNGSGEAMLHFEIRHRGVSVDPSKYLP